MTFYFTYIIVLLFTADIVQSAGQLPILTEAFIEVIEPELKSIIDPEVKIEILAEGHVWTEGPLWLESSKTLLYNDIPRNTTYSWNSKTGVQVYLKPSGFTGENFTGAESGANGLNLSKEGKLVLCQHGDRRMVVMDAPLDQPAPSFTTLTDTYNGMRLNSPNDAVFNKKGELFFTDPPYGLPKQMADPGKEIPFQGVYRMDLKGKTTLLTDKFSRPNGIAFSPDEKTLYVANSDPGAAIWKAFDVAKNGTISNGIVFYDATDQVATSKGLPDGLKVNDKGVVFATGPGGVYIFTPEAKLLGMIRTGQATSNCAFNSDQSYLFVTADMYVLRIALK